MQIWNCYQINHKQEGHLPSRLYAKSLDHLTLSEGHVIVFFLIF